SMRAHYIFFFFSSRRRHTRFSRDWSSDVCSSDLVSATARRGIGVPLLEMSLSCWVLQEPLEDLVVFARSPQWVPWGRCAERLLRSEERRVGEEGRSWLCAAW